MQKFYILLIALLCSILNVLAANDLIIKTNSEKIEALIQEVSETEVRYKKADNPNGPVFIIKSSEISTIIYANGEVQAMTSTQPQTQVPTNTNVSMDDVFSAYEAQQKDKKAKKEARKNKYPWENFILANYQYGFYGQHAVGLTYGRVKQVGWYINFSLGMGFHYKYDYKANYDNKIPDASGYVYPFYTGVRSRNQVSFSGGTVVRLGSAPVFLYAGLGYAYHSVTAEISGNKWVYIVERRSQSFGHGANFDIGIQGNIKGFTIAAGYMLLTNFDNGYLHEIKIGVGGMWKDKKKK